MRERRSIPAKVFSSIETSLLILFLLLFIIVFADSVAKTKYEGDYSNLPRSVHAVSMRGANREDAVLITVIQDGKIYFGPDQVNADTLPARILDGLKDRGAERKVYLSVDKRTRYKTVKNVLDGIHAAGVERIGVLTYQPQMSVSVLR